MYSINKKFKVKPSYIYHIGATTYKIFTPVGNCDKSAEYKGNVKAASTKFWQDQVVIVKPNMLGLEMQRGVPVASVDQSKVNEFVEFKLQEALTFDFGKIHHAIAFDLLFKLSENGLDIKLVKQSEKILERIVLPITSAHGDFHIENIIMIDTNIKVIDWSMFALRGSFVTDYIHFYNYKLAKTNRESWTRSILKEGEYIDRLAQILGLSATDLRLAYSLSRISGEIRQRKSLKYVTRNDIIKYNYVLKQLLNDSPKSIIQCSDSSL